MLVEAGCDGANGGAKEAAPANKELGLEVDAVVVVRLRPFDNVKPSENRRVALHSHEIKAKGR